MKPTFMPFWVRIVSLHLATEIVQEVEPASQTTTVEQEDEESEDESLIIDQADAAAVALGPRECPQS